MRIAAINSRQVGLLVGVFASFTLLLSVAAPAAEAGPAWQIESLAPSSMSPEASATVRTAVPGSASPASDEKQEVTVTAGFGQFRLGFDAETTADLAFNATASQVQAALEALGSIGSGNVEVAGGPGTNSAPEPYVVTFKGALAAQDVEQLSAEDGATPLARTLAYRVVVDNAGDSDLEAGAEPFSFSADLPPGLTAISITQPLPLFLTWDCSSFAATLSCEATTGSIAPVGRAFPFVVTVAVDPGASGLLTAIFQVSGGGAPAAVATADPTRITTEPPVFGIDAFDQRASADAGGSLSGQAGGRPYGLTTSLDFNSVEAPNPSQPSPLKGDPRPVEPVRDVVVDLPPGLLGNPAGIPQCSIVELTSGEATAIKPLCQPGSQLGTTLVRVDRRVAGGPLKGVPVGASVGPFPVYNMIPPPDAPARFGFVVAGSVVLIDIKLRSTGDYGASAVLSRIPEGLAVLGSDLTLWGVPSDPAHTPERACPGSVPPWEAQSDPETCSSQEPQVSFFRSPTSCEDEAAGSLATARADSWVDPGDFDEAGSAGHQAPGYPYPPSAWGAPQGPTGCAKVPFKPSFQAQPTTSSADSPSGLDVHLKVPQGCWDQRDTICQSDLRDAEVKLPAGMSINPASASGQAACSSAQVGLTTPVGRPAAIHFDEVPAACPPASKIGEVTIETPLLEEPLDGSVYLARQGDNPFGSLLAMYLVVEESGVVVKQAGEIRLAPGGQLTTVFHDAPQVPFSDLHVKLFGGVRAPLRTPSSCGTYTSQATLTPWSGKPASVLESAFAITDCAGGGFDPKLSAGTTNPLAGKTSPFVLRLQREDRSEELGALKIALPPGLLGYLKGIPYCGDSALGSVSGALGTGAGEEASPSCPAASRVGTVTVGAGAGPLPFYTSSGRAYLAGPYKGAPLSLAVVAPAVAGPFDLGSVVVRNAIRVDPRSARLTVASDPLPTILHGIPLDLRDVRVNIDRDHFTLNPTSCEEMQIGSTITGALGSSASPSQRFQVAGCDGLGFKPRLSLSLKGGTRRSKFPALTAVMRPRVGNANASTIQVTLPHSEFLAQGHIRTICTRVQFAADRCPQGSVYGRVTAFSPILDYPLYGNVYLRSSDHLLPDMVLALRGPAGQPIEIEAVGRIDSKNGGIRTTFSGLPDAPLSKVVLRLPGGKKSLLENHVDLCRKQHFATVKMDAQNGKVHDFRAALRPPCKGGKSRNG